MPKCSEFMFVHLLMYFIQNVTPGILGKHRANKSKWSESTNKIAHGPTCRINTFDLCTFILQNNSLHATIAAAAAPPNELKNSQKSYRVMDYSFV